MNDFNEEEVIDVEITPENENSEEKEEVKNEITSISIVDELENVDVITDIIFDGKKDVTIRDINYMCNYISEHIGCENCPLSFKDAPICGFVLFLKQFKDAKNLNNAVLNWLNENPPSSYLMDIVNKMPNIDLDTNYHIPKFCVKNIYGKDCKKCLRTNNNTDKFEIDCMDCRKCWREPKDNIEL